VHDYLLSSEIVRFAFVLGVAVSMMLYERRHLTTGSIVVPGYIAIFLVFPTVIVATFVNAFVSYFFINKVLRKWFLLYGRTKFTILALTSITIQTIMLKATPSGPWLWESDVPLVVGVGYVVPALIAHDMGRQGVRKTVHAVMLAAVIVAVPIIVALFLDLPGVNDLAPLEGFGSISFPSHWIPFAVILSAAAAWGVAHNYGLRSGGFVGAGYIALFAADPWQVSLAFVAALAAYALVTRVLMRHLILFGRRKFSSMLLTSSAISWTSLWLADRFLGVELTSHMDVASLALTPLFVPGLLANDMQRTSPARVMKGVLLAATLVLTTVWWVQAEVENLVLQPIWKLLAVAMFLTIFRPQVTAAITRVLRLVGIRPDRDVAAKPAPAAAPAEEPTFEEPFVAEPVVVGPQPVVVERQPEPIVMYPVIVPPPRTIRARPRRHLVPVEKGKVRVELGEVLARKRMLEDAADDRARFEHEFGLDSGGRPTPARRSYDRWLSEHPEYANDADLWLDYMLNYQRLEAEQWLAGELEHRRREEDRWIDELLGARIEGHRRERQERGESGLGTDVRTIEPSEQ
jgi:poly-gamma-glutamate biosynthesis protein PgsC/CapC